MQSNTHNSSESEALILEVITEQLLPHKMQYLAQQAIKVNLNIYLHLCMHIRILPI